MERSLGNCSMTNKIYKIEYGNAHYYKAKGYSHMTRPLTKTQADSRLKKLNKRWDYTTLKKLKNGAWEDIG